MKKILCALGACLLMAGTSYAGAITFADFNNLDFSGGNTVTEDGSGSVTSITKTTVDADNTNFLVTYTDADGTLTFNLLVEGFTGSTASTSVTMPGWLSTATDGSATLGTTSAAVGTVATATGNAFGVGTGMATGSSLRFSIAGPIAYTGGSAVFDGFTDVTVQETGGRDHQCVLGLGDSGLSSAGWDSPGAYTLDAGDPDVLVITSSSATEVLTWGVNDVGFQFTTAIPEPATLGMVVAFGGGLLFVRRILQL
ncbi:hypothetical protein P4B35_07575 [Pontiellaceae bacterium B12227]|nr:hypothetical protein [Pontiellaceae bacterium B12227]